MPHMQFGADASPRLVAYQAQRKSLRNLGIDPNLARKSTTLQMQVMFGQISTSLPIKLAKAAGATSKFGEESMGQGFEKELGQQIDEGTKKLEGQATGAVTDFLSAVEGGADPRAAVKQLGDSITDAVAAFGCDILRSAGSALGTVGGAALGTATAGPIGGMMASAAGGALGGLLGDVACGALEVVLDALDAMFNAIVDFVAGLFEPDDPTEVDDFGETIRPVGWTANSDADWVKQVGAIYLNRMRQRIRDAEAKGEFIPSEITWPQKGDTTRIAAYTLAIAAKYRKKYGFVLWYPGPKSIYGRLYELDFDPWDYTQLKEERREFFPMMVPVLDSKLWGECKKVGAKIWSAQKIPGTAITPLQRQFLIRRIRELGGGQKEWKTLHDITADACYGILPPPAKSNKRYVETLASIDRGRGKGDENAKKIYEAYTNGTLKAEFVKILVADGYNKPQAIEEAYYGFKSAYQAWKKYDDAYATSGYFEADYEKAAELAANGEKNADGSAITPYQLSTERTVGGVSIGGTTTWPNELASFYESNKKVQLPALFKEYELAKSQIYGLRDLLKKYVPSKTLREARIKIAEDFASSGGSRVMVSMLTAKEFNLLPKAVLEQLDKDIKTGQVIDPKFREAVLQNRKYASSILRAMRGESGEKDEFDSAPAKIGPVVGLAALLGASFVLSSPLPAMIGVGAYLISKRKKAPSRPLTLEEKEAAELIKTKKVDPSKGSWKSSANKAGSKANSAGKVADLSSAMGKK